MSDLIQDLRKDHSEILILMGDVEAVSIDTPAGQATLAQVRERIITHHKREDAELYPVLRTIGQSNETVARMTEHFINEMATISALALEFFDKYRYGGSQAEFARDFAALQSALVKRIANEENSLYKEYRSLS